MASGARLECIPNVSEGRDAGVLHRLGEAVDHAGARLVDVHSDVPVFFYEEAAVLPGRRDLPDLCLTVAFGECGRSPRPQRGRGPAPTRRR